jgi:hypothetical protein
MAPAAGGDGAAGGAGRRCLAPGGLDPPALLEPVVAAQLGLACPAFLVRGLRDDGGHTGGPALVVEGTIVRYAVEVWVSSPERTFSASTRTPTSIELRQAAFTIAFTVSRSPT